MTITKNKTIIKILSVLSAFIICFNILLSGTYCLVLDTQTGKSEINYNLFNFNLNPLFVDEDTGEGIYFAGYVPEFQFASLTSENSFSVGYDYLIQQLQTDDTITIKFNCLKTQIYTYDGEKINIWPNGQYFNGNMAMKLQNFLYFCGIGGFNGDSENILIYDYMQENNYIFDNYVITYDIRYDRGSYVDYGIYYPTLSSLDTYPSAVTDCGASICAYKSVYNNYNYSTDYYVSRFDIYLSDSDDSNTFTNEDFINLEYYNPMTTEAELLFVFDFCDVANNLYDRVYYTYTELLDMFGSSCITDSKFSIDINSIKTLSKNYVTGFQKNIYIYGIGVCYANLEASDYFNFLNNQDIVYSNSYYVSFQYDTTVSTSVPNNHKIFELTNNYTAFTVVEDAVLTDSDGNSVFGSVAVDSEDTGRRQSDSTGSDDRNDNNTGITLGDLNFLDGINELVEAAVNTFNTIINFVDEITFMASKFLTFLPSDILTLIYVTIEFCLIVGVIKFISGVLH